MPPTAGKQGCCAPSWLLAGALALAVSTGTGTSLAQTPAPSRDAVKQLEDKKGHAVKELDDKKRALETIRTKSLELGEEVDSLGRERADLNQRLIDTAERVQQGEARLSEIEERIGQLSGQESQIRGSIDERHVTIAKLLAAMQRIGGQPPPAIVTRRDDVLKMVRSAMLMASLYPELKEQADALSSDLGNLMRLQTDLAAEGKRLAEEHARLNEERERIKGLLAEKKELLAARQDELKDARKAAEQHGKSVAELSELVRRMDAELAKRTAQYESELARAEAEAVRAKEEADARGGQPATEIAPKPQTVAFVSPGRIKPAVPFADAKKSLRMPVRGERLRRFGDEDGFGGSMKGISVRTRGSAQVTSPTDGWVSYADEFRGYGQLLIINAGGGYHILLAGMQQIDVSVGQFVLAGEPVAVMGVAASGQEGERARPVLYIEFRKDGQPIDPDPWWAESSEKVQG